LDEAPPKIISLQIIRALTMFLQLKLAKLELTQGDITTQEVDAIVNAANADLAGGGGVDGAIHRAAGPILMEQTQVRYPRGCPTGEAVVTDAGRLPARFVFHAVGPVWEGGLRGEPALLAGAYRHCLELARQHACQGIAFPAISTGVYGYPKDLAAQISLTTVRDFLEKHGEPALVRFVLFDGGTYGAYARVLETLRT
jgi:O-acetyl-ADP-ribose deacetylase (regulator of RNase III)